MPSCCRASSGVVVLSRACVRACVAVVERAPHCDVNDDVHWWFMLVPSIHTSELVSMSVTATVSVSMFITVPLFVSSRLRITHTSRMSVRAMSVWH